jgi:hypothetical protein
MRLLDPERSTLAEIGKHLGRTALQQVACVAKPDTILAWYRRLIARKSDGSKLRIELAGAASHPAWKRSLSALNEYIEHHHFEWNHQGKGNLLLFPSPDVPLSPKSRTVCCRDLLGGLLKFYSRVA